jgi:hypothetical protein
MNPANSAYLILSLTACAALACGGVDEAESAEARRFPGLSHVEGGHWLGDVVAGSDPSFVPRFETAEAAGVGQTSQAIINGDVTPEVNVDDVGVVSIWVFNPQFSEWRQWCTGTLIRNDIVLTASHCFEQAPSGSFAVIFGPFNSTAQSAVPIAAFADPSGFDVAVILLDHPLTIAGSTTTWNRALSDGRAGRTAVAIGYGLPIAGENGPPSTICKTKTQGCLDDPRPQRTSVHQTQWQQNAVGRELFVGPNALGQLPTHGDSGHGLIDVFAPQAPVIGVGSAIFNAQPPTYPTAHADYVPLQDVGWVCQLAQCI